MIISYIIELRDYKMTSKERVKITLNKIKNKENKYVTTHAR